MCDETFTLTCLVECLSHVRFQKLQFTTVGYMKPNLNINTNLNIKIVMNIKEENTQMMMKTYTLEENGLSF